jgi:hypothetical protein
MKRYMVTMTRSAETELAAIWIQAADRQSVTAAQAIIAAELAVDPSSKGVEVAEGLRRLAVLPLLELFEVQELDQRVEITKVRRVT